MKRSLVLLLACGACSTLGPVPVATGVSAIPRGRFDGELQVGAMPGYYLSSATVKAPRGSPIGQISAVIEPSGAVPGLLVGGRVFGPSHDSATDPLLGYRTSVGEDRRISLAIVGFLSHSESMQKGAQYKATRGGAELSGDLRIGAQRPWLEPHVELTASVTGVSASGDYCEGTDGYGADCPDPPALPLLHHASASGVYPAVTAGATLLVGHHRESWIHGARALVLVGAGLMPRVIGDMQASAQPYVSAGLALSISIGAPR